MGTEEITLAEGLAACDGVDAGVSSMVWAWDGAGLVWAVAPGKRTCI